MEIVVCEHIETIEQVPGLDLKVAQCSICGQIRRFRVAHKDSTVITKLGRIDGKIVMPPAGTRYEVTPEESRLVRECWDMMREEKEEKKFREKMNKIGKGEYKRRPFRPGPQERLGVYFKCAGCGRDIYVRKSRTKEDHKAEHWCRRCHR